MRPSMSNRARRFACCVGSASVLLVALACSTKDSDPSLGGLAGGAGGTVGSDSLAGHGAVTPGSGGLTTGGSGGGGAVGGGPTIAIAGSGGSSANGEAGAG